MSFIQGAWADGKRFYGRSAELNRLREEDGWTWICGQRRIGKTSLLRRFAEQRRAAGALVFFSDLAPLPINCSEQQFFEHWLTEQFQELDQLGIEAEALRRLPPALRWRQTMQRLLLTSRAPMGKQRVVLIWDEAERLVDIEENHSGWLDQIRGQIQPLEDVRIILSAPQTLTNLYALPSKVSKFIETFVWQPLCALSNEESAELLRCKQTGGWKSSIAQKFVDAVVRWTGGHPYVLQRFGAELMRKTEAKGKKVSSEVLLYCQDSLVTDPNVRRIADSDFKLLTPPQQQILTLLCHSEDSLASSAICTKLNLPDEEVKNALASMRSYGYVNDEGVWSLRYGFYRRLLPRTPVNSRAHVGYVTRFVSTKAEARSKTTPEPMPEPLAGSVLIFSSNPPGTDRLKIEREVKKIRAVLRGSHLGKDGQPGYQPEISFAGLRQALLDQKPSIVHFCGHGEGEEGLVLADDSGAVELISAEALAELFALLVARWQLGCVVLNACYSQQQADAIVQHVPYVIGMDRDISDEAAISFSEAFYGSLARGMTIREAFEFGRNAAHAKDAASQHVPILRIRRG